MLPDSINKQPLDEEVTALRRRVAELERALELAKAPRASAGLPEEQPAEKAARTGTPSMTAPGSDKLLNDVPAMIFYKDRDHRYRFVSEAYCKHYRIAREAILGNRDEDIFDAETARRYHDIDEDIMASGIPRLNVEIESGPEEAGESWTLESNVPYLDSSGSVIGLLGVVLDITARKKTERALLRTESELLATKQRLLETIAALSTPVLPIEDGILVLPLVGHVDSSRSGQLMEVLLQGIQRYRAKYVIIDLTGVPIIDSAVALNLQRACHAARLLGAQCILVGISSSIALALTRADEALAELIVLRDLQAGVRYAMARQKASRE